MKRKILIVGGGHFQLVGIEKALKLNLEVIVTDGNVNAPGFKLVRNYVHLDIKDIQGHINLARKLKIDAAISFATDAALQTVLSINEELHLSGTARNAIEFGLSKEIQREFCKQNDIPSPKFLVCSENDDLSFENITSRLSLPIIIKPVDNAGSRGVNVVRRSEDLGRCLTEAFSFSSQKKVIIEEFIEGVECTVEGVCIDGLHTILAMSHKEKFPGVPTVAQAIHYPPKFDQNIQNKMRDLVQRMMKILGLQNAPTHTELIIDRRGNVYLIETAMRGGGYNISDSVVKIVSGVDLPEVTLKIALGEKIKLPKIQNNNCLLYFLYPGVGILKNIHGWNEIQEIPEVHGDLLVREGHKIGDLTWDGARVGTIVIGGDTNENVLNKLKTIQKILHFEMQ